MHHFILEPGEQVATVTGYWKGHRVPAGQFAVAHHGELSNGGRGPILSANQFYDTEAEAMAEAMRLSTE
jgi:hypothetical protein